MLISVSSLTCSLQALSVSFLPGSELMRVGILEYQVPSVEAVDGSGFHHDEHIVCSWATFLVFKTRANIWIRSKCYKESISKVST